MDEQEKQDRKTLQDYYNNLSDSNIKLLEKQESWASSIDEHSINFSQFLVSIGAGLLAIFFSVKDFNNLIVNQQIFNWAVVIYLVSFILFVFYSKEKIDAASARLVENSRQSESAFNSSYAILNKQFENGINMEIFYKDVQFLIGENNKRFKDIENEAKKNPADYFLEFYTFCLITTFWFVLFSTQSWCTVYLYVGIIIIFFISHNQNKIFYEFIKLYSNVMYKIFPTK